MSELLYNENAFQLVDFCTQVHCELGKGQGMAVHRIAEHGWREMTKLPPFAATAWQANDEWRRCVKP